MRTFITLEFDKKTKEEIMKVQNFIRENSTRGRFKYIDNFHLTLKFLGETDFEKIDLIHRDLSVKLKDFNEFKLCFTGIGAFGIGDVIKTIYIKTCGSTEVLENIVKIIDRTAYSFGFKMENRYTPHVTIAQDVELKFTFNELQDRLKNKFYREVFFNRVVIMKSEQIGNRRVYTPLKTILLDKRSL